MTAINFTNAIGVHEQAMVLRTERAAVLANNLVNSETPGFKARDFDFAQALQAAQGESSQFGSQIEMSRTHHSHIALQNQSAVSVELGYRIPHQASIDGNTVDEHTEGAAFTRNALEFGASFRFLNGRFSGLKKAISGD